MVKAVGVRNACHCHTELQSTNSNGKSQGVWMLTNAALNFRREDSVGQSRGGGVLTIAALNYRIEKTAMVKAEGGGVLTNAGLNYRREDSDGQDRDGWGCSPKLHWTGRGSEMLDRGRQGWVRGVTMLQ